MSKIVQLGNLKKGSISFPNPQTGRVYSIEGISPTLNTCQGGEREPKVIVKVDFNEENTDFPFNSKQFFSQSR